MIIAAEDIERYDVILDPLTGMDMPVDEVESDGNIVTIYDPDGVRQSFMPEQRVALLERPWLPGKTEADMLDTLQSAIGRAWGAVITADGDPVAMREAVRRHVLSLLGALEAYQLGRSEAALAASDPNAPAPLPPE